jgi:hypothetical protein
VVPTRIGDFTFLVRVVFFAILFAPLEKQCSIVPRGIVCSADEVLEVGTP